MCPAGTFTTSTGAGSCTACGVVRKSYVPPAAFYSSLLGAEFDHPQLNNALYKSVWAALTNDQNQVIPRTVHTLMRCDHGAERLWWVLVVLV